jgi:dTDP-4-dehydrorhamnose 3,5-epimerase-like enzyme
MIIKGNSAVDDRGVVSFVNDFHFENVKRFYSVQNFSTDTVRAFHGHLIEEKYVYVAAGSALVVVAEMAEGELRNPEKFVLTDRNPRVLHIPAGHANGFRALEYDTRILFFSTATLEESICDDYRFDWTYFGENFWEVANR